MSELKIEQVREFLEQADSMSLFDLARYPRALARLAISLHERLAAAEAAGRDVLAALTALEAELLPGAVLRGEGLSPALIAEHAPKIQAAKALFALAPEVAR